MVDQHNDSSQKALQLNFDTDEFFKMQNRRATSGQNSGNTFGSKSRSGEQTQNLTGKCLDIVH